MGKSTMIMLFLLAFGPNSREPVSSKEAVPPAIQAETLSTRTAPEQLARPADDGVRPPNSFPAAIGMTEPMPDCGTDIPEAGKKNG